MRLILPDVSFESRRSSGKNLDGRLTFVTPTRLAEFRAYWKALTSCTRPINSAKFISPPKSLFRMLFALASVPRPEKVLLPLSGRPVTGQVGVAFSSVAFDVPHPDEVSAFFHKRELVSDAFSFTILSASIGARADVIAARGSAAT